MPLAARAVLSALILWAIGVLDGGTPAGIALAEAAPRQGTVTLAGLPAGAHVFVDGKEVRPRDGALRLAPGSHEIQVEALEAPEAGRVMAMRRTVEVAAGETSILEARLAPVYALTAEVIGGLGPGPRGRPGLPAAGFAVPPDLPTQVRLVRVELLTLLDDLDRRMAFIQMYHPRLPAFYADGPLRPAGHMIEPGGPAGRAGRPGDLLLIQDEAARPVVDVAMTRLGLVDLEREVTTAAAAARRKPFPPAQLRIQTPALQARLDQQIGRHPRLPALAGPPGPAGPITAVPPDMRPPRLTPEEVEALIGRLEQDAELKARIDALRRRIGER
jgi:hypothetical protein